MRSSVIGTDRGTWLDEADELAAYCFKCGLEFRLGERHHCRRCGSTFCAKCSQRRAPLYLYNIETPERVCDACANALVTENKLAKKHLPLLQRGMTFGIRSNSLLGSLLSNEEMALVKLRRRNDALVVLDHTSVSEDAPRNLIMLAAIGSVDETPPTTILLRDIEHGRQVLKLEAPTTHDRVDFASALRAAVQHAQAPNLAKTIDNSREQQRIQRHRLQAQQEKEKQTRDRRQHNANLRDNIRSKYNIHSHSSG